MALTRLLVCGDRLWTNKYRIWNVLDGICIDNGWITDKDEYGNYLPMVELISGMARGADSIAVDWAINCWIHYYPFHANWQKYGKRAGPIRNQQMLDGGKPDYVIAFHNDIPSSRGTKHMITIALKAGLPVLVFSETRKYPDEEVLALLESKWRSRSTTYTFKSESLGNPNTPRLYTRMSDGKMVPFNELPEDEQVNIIGKEYGPKR